MASSLSNQALPFSDGHHILFKSFNELKQLYLGEFPTLWFNSWYRATLTLAPKYSYFAHLCESYKNDVQLSKQVHSNISGIKDA